MNVKSPAKINLFLHITGRRPDGYHNLLSLMCGVSLYDDILLAPSSRPGISIRCDHAAVPEDKTNLAYRAAELFFNHLGRQPVFPGAGDAEGLAIAIKKNIPVAAGLGGGSSNAASVLTALNRIFDHPFSNASLDRMGLSLGADVPFFLFGRPAIAKGIGEQLASYEKLKDYTILLVCPEFSVSTAWVYKNLNLRLTKCEKKLKKFLFGRPLYEVGQHLCNDLESVTTGRHPEILQIKQKLMEMNAKGALMSGSGPSVFGIYEEPARAESAYDALVGEGNWQIFITKPLLSGKLEG
ncbi:MAG: 4-(cytidine 5'-diphospho)-2-C-methyl-D-erythritol kinase [Thermodesulfobacteriota bacterium]